ncbi:hypothetical protein MMC18_007514 [Xylographa bjoerkii]|nr:hypothetical protein [Xylographa bjoerkii]
MHYQKVLAVCLALGAISYAAPVPDISDDVAERDALKISIETDDTPSTWGHGGMKWVLPKKTKQVDGPNGQSGRLNVANGGTHDNLEHLDWQSGRL